MEFSTLYALRIFKLFQILIFHVNILDLNRGSFQFVGFVFISLLNHSSCLRLSLFNCVLSFLVVGVFKQRDINSFIFVKIYVINLMCPYFSPLATFTIFRSQVDECICVFCLVTNILFYDYFQVKMFIWWKAKLILDLVKLQIKFWLSQLNFDPRS